MTTKHVAIPAILLRNPNNIKPAPGTWKDRKRHCEQVRRRIRRYMREMGMVTYTCDKNFSIVGMYGMSFVLRVNYFESETEAYCFYGTSVPCETNVPIGEFHKRLAACLGRHK